MMNTHGNTGRKAPRYGIATLLSGMLLSGLTGNFLRAAPIHDAAAAGDTATVYSLIRAYPTMLELRTRRGASPLYEAALNGHTELVRGLIAMHAEVTVATTDGLTPLHWAALHGDVDLCHVLIEAGADVNARSTVQGNTPLHEVWGGGYVEVAQLLIEHGAAIDAVEKFYGMTILHYAAAHFKPKLLKALLDAGADPAIEDNRGRTVFDWARDSESKHALERWRRAYERR